MPAVRRAVDKFCKRCRFDASDTAKPWRQQIQECSDMTCPLWVVRPKVVNATSWRVNLFPPW